MGLDDYKLLCVCWRLGMVDSVTKWWVVSRDALFGCCNCFSQWMVLVFELMKGLILLVVGKEGIASMCKLMLAVRLGSS